MDGVISREVGKLQDWSFIGRSTNRRIGRFTEDARLFPHCQTFHRVAPNHKVAHFTGDAKSQGRAFHGRWPNHRAAHFTGDAKSQKRAFHELPVFTHFSSLFHFSSFGFDTFFCKPFFFRTFFFRVNFGDRRQTNKQANKLTHHILSKYFFASHSFLNYFKNFNFSDLTNQML